MLRPHSDDGSHGAKHSGRAGHFCRPGGVREETDQGGLGRCWGRRGEAG